MDNCLQAECKSDAALQTLARNNVNVQDHGLYYSLRDLLNTLVVGTRRVSLDVSREKGKVEYASIQYAISSRSWFFLGSCYRPDWGECVSDNA